MRSALFVIAALGLAACAPTMTNTSYPPPPPTAPTTPTRPQAPVILPSSGPILYTCDNGQQLTVTFGQSSAMVAVIGGVSMNLPNTGTADAPVYSNGRYTLRGRGAATYWEPSGGSPGPCRGS